MAHLDYETGDDEDIFNEASDTEETRRTFVDLIADRDGQDHNLTKTIDEAIEEPSICQTDSEDSEDGGMHYCRERFNAIKDLDDDLSQTPEEGSAVLKFEETEQMREGSLHEDTKARYRSFHNDQRSLGTPAGALNNEKCILFGRSELAKTLPGLSMELTWGFNCRKSHTILGVGKGEARAPVRR